MPPPRLQLFELEDQRWFPDLLRRGLTEYLMAIAARTRPYAAVLPSLNSAVASVNAPLIRDYCSGAGGPWLGLLPALTAVAPDVRLELTDAFPNTDALLRFPIGAPISYRSAPLSATDAWPADASLATFFASFHHFPPSQARKILRQASVTQTPIAVFEGTHRSITALLLMCLVPIAVLVLTPTIRPLKWWRILLTYLIPVIPLAVWFDGVVSCLRTYRPDELLALAASIPDSGMDWRAGEWRTAGQPLPVTYLIGTPTVSRRSARRRKCAEAADCVEAISPRSSMNIHGSLNATT